MCLLAVELPKFSVSQMIPLYDCKHFLPFGKLSFHFLVIRSIEILNFDEAQFFFDYFCF